MAPAGKARTVLLLLAPLFVAAVPRPAVALNPMERAQMIMVKDLATQIGQKAAQLKAAGLSRINIL